MLDTTAGSQTTAPPPPPTPLFSRGRLIMVALLLGVSPLVSPIANRLVDAVQPLTHPQIIGLLLLGFAASSGTVAAALFPTPASRRSSIEKDSIEKDSIEKNAADASSDEGNTPNANS